MISFTILKFTYTFEKRWFNHNKTNYLESAALTYKLFNIEAFQTKYGGKAGTFPRVDDFPRFSVAVGKFRKHFYLNRPILLFKLRARFEGRRIPNESQVKNPRENFSYLACRGRFSAYPLSNKTVVWKALGILYMRISTYTVVFFMNCFVHFIIWKSNNAHFSIETFFMIKYYSENSTWL